MAHTMASCSRAHGDAYVAALCDARLVDLEGAAHLAVLEQPVKLAALVNAHLGS